MTTFEMSLRVRIFLMHRYGKRLKICARMRPDFPPEVIKDP